MSDSMKLIDLAEKQAEAKFDAIMSDTVALGREVHVTFVFIATAGSVVMGYAMTLIKDAHDIAHASGLLVPLLTVLVHLCAIAWVLVLKCMMARTIIHKGNEPTNILTEEVQKHVTVHGIDSAREDICQHLEAGIRQNATRNTETAKWLNWVRCGLLLVPITFLATWGLTLACL